MSTYNITSNGPGDAFNGDKYINNDVFIDMLMVQVTETVSQEQIRDILIKVLTCLQEHKVVSALEHLNVISNISTLDDEARLAISSLRVILTEEAMFEDIERVKNYSSSSKFTPLTEGLAEAALLILIAQKYGDDAANQRFEEISQLLNDLTIPQYVYLLKLATNEYIEAISESIETLSDFELFALFEKSIDLSMFEQAEKALDKLIFLKPLQEFKREKIILHCLSGHNQIDSDYYCLTYEEKINFDKLCSDLIRLIDESEVPDFKLLYILYHLYRYTHMTDVSIVSCLRNNKEHLKAKSFFDDDIFESRILCRASKGFDELSHCEPEELMLVLINQKEDGLCNFGACSLLSQSDDSELILGTINRLAKKENASAKANLIALACMSAYVIEEREFPFKDVETAIYSFQDIKLNPSYVDIVASELKIHGYSELSVLLQDIIFSGSVPWFSEPFYNYLTSLYAAGQFKTLEEKLNALNAKDKEREEVKILFSLLAGNQKNYQLAAKILHNNIVKYQEKESLSEHEQRNLVYLWSQYLKSVYSENKEKARELSREIPLSIFHEYFEDYSWELMFYFSHRIEDVAEIAIDWFCNDPYKNAKHYFSFVFGALQQFPEQHLPMTIGKYQHAFHYIGEHKSHIKLVVRKKFVTKCPQYLIDNNGVVAKKLIEAKKGDAILLPVKLFTLSEKLSPIIAVNRIASEIMDDDEEEVFHIIKLPENPTAEEIWAELDKITAPMKESRQKLKPLMEKSFPVDFKYSYINGQDNFEKGILAVLCPDIKVVISSSDEPQVNTICTDFVIDEVTAIYLACIGTHLFDNCSWHMTDEVFTLLKEYCESYRGMWPVFNDEHYTVYFKEYDEKSALPSNFIANLSVILEKSSKHSVSKLNVPLDIKLKLRNLCNHSFLMSHALAVNLGVGHFCIDYNTRVVMRELGFDDSPLQPFDFKEKIIRNASAEIVHNLIHLNIQNNSSSIAYACIIEVINKGDESQLDALVTFITMWSTSICEQNDVLCLVHACVRKMAEQIIYQKVTSGLERVLQALLCFLTSSSTLQDKDIQILVESLPVRLLSNEGLGKVESSFINKIAEAFSILTDIYHENLEKAVRKNNHSVSKFWKVFDKLR